jgi:hypothetical protein
VWVDIRRADNRELKTCPVRNFTPQVEEALEWFAMTHEQQVVGMGGVVWRRVSLPGPGSIGDQDARLMTMLDVVRAARNELLSESTAEDRDRELQRFRQKESR